MLAARVLYALLLCALLVNGAPVTPPPTLVVTSAGRTALQHALRRLLRCDQNALTFDTAEQCAMVDADEPALHRTFPVRDIHLDAPPLVGVTLRLRTVRDDEAIVYGKEDAVLSTAVNPLNATSTTRIEIDGAASTADADAKRLELWLLKGTRGSGRAMQEGVASAAPWNAWMGLPVSVRILGALGFAAAAVLLLFINRATLSDEIVAGGSAPHAHSVAAKEHSANATSQVVISQGGTLPHDSVIDGAVAPALDVAPTHVAAAPLATAGGASPAALSAAAAGLQDVTASSTRRPAEMRRLVWTLVPLVAIVFVNVVCDLWRVFPLTDKMTTVGTDMFWALGLLAGVLVLAFSLKVQERDGESLMAMKQTEEAKGWMMFLFLIYHYWDVKSVYNLIRLLVSTYVFFTGFGNTISLASRPPTLQKFAGSFLRINFLVTLIAVAMGTPWMLYYICALHTFWTAAVYVINIPGPVTKPVRYAIAFALTALVWNIVPLFDLVFLPVRPLMLLGGSTYEWYFRSKLDVYSALVGCLVAEARPFVMTHLRAYDSRAMAMLRGGCLVAVLVLHFNTFMTIPLRVDYNKYHPYTSWIPIVAFVLLRNNTTELRRTHSHHLALLGRHSLELYLLQFHVWLGKSAKTNVALVPEFRGVSAVAQSVVFVALSVVAFRATSSAVLWLSAAPPRAFAAVCASLVLLSLAPLL